MRRLHRPVVRAQDPALDQRGYSVHAGHRHVRRHVRAEHDGALVVVAQIGLVVYVRKLGLDETAAAAARPEGVSNTQELGHLLYTQYLYPFEIAAVILLVAIVAAITLTMRDRPGQKVQDIGKQVAVRAKDRVRIVKMDAEARQ